MNASSEKSLPLYTPEIYDQVIDSPVLQPRKILVLEKEYLQLKNEVGYWQAMHKEAGCLGKKPRKEAPKRRRVKQDL